ncbi:MAG: hypothetical protein U9R53_10780 [Chloroflexota bacterium]|nr:hypothetical protein [Chloroflexota bacterium]
MDKPLDNQNLEKRLEWLDNERRNDKTLIASMQQQLESISTENATLRTQSADMQSEITRLNTLMIRLEQFEQDITNLQTDTNRHMEGFKDAVQEKQIQTDINQREIETLNENFRNFRSKIADHAAINESLEDRKEEELRLYRLIEELKTQVSEIARFDDDYKRNLHMIEENHRQDAKRLTDFQGEIATIRKRQDETRGKQELVGDNIRKLDGRIKNLLNAESERRQTQTAFTEKINIKQVERDRVFNQWADRFEKMEQITADLDEEISALENTHRSVKQSQGTLDEITQQFRRRINEITEVQRLNEDRFRREWTTFKSDDQKRWANYSLSQEEQHREMNKSLDSLADRIANLEDLLDTLQENFQKLSRNNLKHMQSLLNTYRESIDNLNTTYKD